MELDMAVVQEKDTVLVLVVLEVMVAEEAKVEVVVVDMQV